MPICKPCLFAAEQDYQWLACSACGRAAVVYNDAPPVAERSVVVHKVDILYTEYRVGEPVRQWYGRQRCIGSTRPPVYKTGHDACEGCPCQHRPRGSWNQRPGEKA